MDVMIVDLDGHPTINFFIIVCIIARHRDLSEVATMLTERDAATIIPSKSRVRILNPSKSKLCPK
jgi:hypothetical protein